MVARDTGLSDSSRQWPKDQRRHALGVAAAAMTVLDRASKRVRRIHVWLRRRFLTDLVIVHSKIDQPDNRENRFGSVRTNSCAGKNNWQ